MRTIAETFCTRAIPALSLGAALTGCPKGDAPPAPSAEPRASVSAPPPVAASASASASAPKPAVTHEPGTVPVPKPRPSASAAAPPSTAPATFAKVAATKARKVGKSPSVSFADKRALAAIVSDDGFDLVDPANGAGFSIKPHRFTAFAFSSDGALLAATGPGDQVSVWDTASGALRHTFPIKGATLVFSPDGKRLAAGDSEFLTVRDLADGREVMKAAPEGNPFVIAFGAQGKEIVANVNNVGVFVYAADTGRVIAGGGSAETTATFGIAVSPDGRFAAAGAPAGHGLQVFDVHAWGPRTLVVLPENACQEHINPSFSASGKYVFGGGGTRWIKGFEVGTWKPYASFHAPPGREIAGAADDLSRVVLTKDSKGGVVVNVSTGSETPLEKAIDGASYAMSMDGLHVAATSDTAVRIWSAKTGKIEYETSP